MTDITVLSLDGGLRRIIVRVDETRPDQNWEPYWASDPDSVLRKETPDPLMACPIVAIQWINDSDTEWFGSIRGQARAVVLPHAQRAVNIPRGQQEAYGDSLVLEQSN